MTQAQQNLLRRVIASAHFAQAHSLQRILNYLCEHSADPDPAALRESQIARTALGRPADFDPKIDPIVRVSIAGIRDRLRAYFENEGAHEPLRMSIPRGAYRVVCAPAPGSETSANSAVVRSSALRRFWAGHFAPDSSNILIYTELLFFRDPAGNYLRNIYVNHLPDGLKEVRERCQLPDTAALRPSYHFLSAGEVYCVFSLLRLFGSVGIPLDPKNARFCSWNDLQHSNCILLGSSRTNPFSDSLQGGGNFLVGHDNISNLAPQEGEPATYRGRRYMEGKLERLTEYALVTRRPGLAPGTVVTMISGNHGRAIEGAGQFLALEDKVEGLLQATGFSDLEALPEHFQILLSVEMIDYDEEVIQVDYIAHRVIGAAGRESSDRTQFAAEHGRS